MGVAHHVQIPSLILNADDDPVCDRRSTDENIPPLLGAEGHAKRACPKTVLLRYRRGGHCLFARGWRAHRWSDELGARFLARACTEIAPR